MKKAILLSVTCLIFFGCNQPVEKTRGIPPEGKVKTEAPKTTPELEKDLQEKGYQTFTYEEGDSTYLMQQYYIAFLKTGKNRDQDSTEIANLQEQHLEHLSRLSREGYTSLTGPMGDDGEIRGIVVFNTPGIEEADSLARLDPMVKAGRLEVEVRPWWVAKGGKLD